MFWLHSQTLPLQDPMVQWSFCARQIVINSFLLFVFSLELGKIDQDIHKYNTPGFSGCLSRVQFNQITPLKAALRQTNISSHIYTEGELVESNCGANPQTIQPMSSATDPWPPDSGTMGMKW